MQHFPDIFSHRTLCSNKQLAGLVRRRTFFGQCWARAFVLSLEAVGVLLGKLG